jgi:hypothetical protein
MNTEGSHEPRRERAVQGLPIDVADPAIVAAYQPLRRPVGGSATKAKASKGKR